jgi:crotonobetainyl-CoA:carnitine CoA-transferase CaiB-like acyl-CoA transferase
MVVQAMGGVMSLTGWPGGPPTRVGTSIGDITAGLFGAIGVLAALRERETTGLGRHVDVAMLDSQVAILENAIALRCHGRKAGSLGARHSSIAPFAAFARATGPDRGGHDEMFRRLCAARRRRAAGRSALLWRAGTRAQCRRATPELENDCRARRRGLARAPAAAGVPCADPRHRRSARRPAGPRET